MSGTRRRFLATAGLTGLSVLVAGCSDTDANGDDDGTDDTDGNGTDDTDANGNGNEEISDDAGDLTGSTVDWPMFRRSRYNTAHVEGTAIEEPTIDWEYETGDDIWGSPVIVDGTVYVASYDRHLYALDLASGEQEWRFEMERVADGTPGVADGTVVCGSFDNTIYAVDAATGEQNWAYDAGGIVRSSPTIVDGTVYIGAHCQSAECAEFTPDEEVGELLALDLSTSDLLWSFETTAGIVSTPAVTDSAVFVGTSAGQAVALDRETGETRWSYDTGAFVASSPAIVDGSVYFGDVRGTFYALDATDGTELWTHEPEQRRNYPNSPAVDEDTVYIGANYDGATRAGVIAYDRTGGQQWTQNLAGDGQVGSSPLVLDGHLYIGAHGSQEHGGLYALTTDGTVQWSIGTEDEGVGASPAFVDGSLVFGAVDGRVISVT
jgi:outer membrane protein assembly factor BamB